MVAESNRRPYGPYAHFEAFLDRIRTRNLPGVVDTNFLNVVQIPRDKQGQLKVALEFLNLVDEEGVPTGVLESYAGTTEEEAQGVLREALKTAYASDFKQIDPTQDSQLHLKNWFQRYEPRSATGKMVTFFLGACRQAGIEVKDPPRERKIQAGRATTSNGRKRQRTKTSDSGNGPAPIASEPEPSRPVTAEPQSVPSVDAGVLVSVTNEDIAELDDEEFTDVWSALGKIVRRRAQRDQMSGSGQDSEPIESEEESAED